MSCKGTGLRKNKWEFITQTYSEKIGAATNTKVPTSAVLYNNPSIKLTNRAWHHEGLPHSICTICIRMAVSHKIKISHLNYLIKQSTVFYTN